MVLALIGVQTETVRKAVLRVEAHSLHGASVLFDIRLLSDALVGIFTKLPVIARNALCYPGFLIIEHQMGALGRHR